MRKLGQHFLINKSAIRKIIEALELKTGDVVVEIGPGHGELTEAIIERLKDLKIERFKLIAIEKDQLLAKDLRSKIQNSRFKNIEIIEGDALKELPKITKPYTQNPIPYKIVGNIPYYITGRLLRILSGLEDKPSLVVLTIQKEVAERIIAKPPRMNLLAAITRFWAEPKIIMRLKAKDFSPPPKVDSAVIQLITHNSQPTTHEIENYCEFIKIIFKQPRKTLLNNLQKGLKMPKNEILEKIRPLSLDEQTRPQNLTIDLIKQLIKLFLNSKF